MEEAVFSINPRFDKNTTVEVPGWRSKLEILYSIEVHAGVNYLCWKIKNTEQVFRIPASIVYEKHGLDFSEHFSLTLEKFREDYIEWRKTGFTEEWMKRYQKMFQYLIE